MSNSIENEKNDILNYVVGILAFCGVTGWSLYYLFSLSPFFAWAACIIFLAGTIFASIWFTGAKSKEALENSICKQLDKQGFRHEKQDGTLYVIKNAIHYLPSHFRKVITDFAMATEYRLPKFI